MNKKIIQNFYEKYISVHPKIKKIIVRLYKYKKLRNSIKKNIKGKKNILKIGNAILLNVEFNIRGNENKITIDHGSVLRNVKFFIRGDNHMVNIGKNCIFSKGSLIWFEDYNGYLDIGDNTLIEDVHFAVTEPFSKITVGKNYMFVYGIDIRTGDSHSIIDHMTKKRINYAKDVNVGEHVWLAAHCKILKGVSIANNSVIGTSAVVSKSILEENSISAGNPSKIVKRNINWEVERVYEK